MTNILVTGAKGQLGSELRELAKTTTSSQFFFTDRETLDITDQTAVKRYVEQQKITVIVNCAAYTAVDAAEENEALADAINHLAVKHIAQLCKELQIKLVHISTDYVFNGKHCKPYKETDVPNPQSVYGASKLAGEQAILKISPANTLIIRTAWVYSRFGTNFVKTMLRLAQQKTQLNVVSDQVGAPTYARDLADAILQILPQIKNNAPKVVHYTNQGVCSWYDFAKAIFDLKGLTVAVQPIATEAYPTPVKRPAYSVMDTTKITERYGVQIPYWRTALKHCLQQNFDT